MHALSRMALVVSLCTAGCGGATLPRLLTSTVHRTEEQGIDFSSVGTWTLEISLEDGRGLATFAARATDVTGSDAHTIEETRAYDVHASRGEGALRLALTPRAGSPPTAEAVTLECTPWTDTERTIESFEPLPTTGGVAWACALPADRTFALGRVAIEHLPREGRAFVLFSETHQIVIDEEVSQSSRTVRLRPAAPPRR